MRIIAILALAALAFMSCGTDPIDSSGTRLVSQPIIPSTGITTDLIAGAGQNDVSKGIDVGSVRIWNDGLTLHVAYTVDAADWSLSEAHVWTGSTPNDIPQNAAPGLFPYKAELADGTRAWQVDIPLASFDPIYVAAHATVNKAGQGTDGGFQQGTISVIDLIAGQHIDAGSIQVSIVGDNLVVEYITEGEWKLYATQLAIGSSLTDLPQNRNGNPIPGHFQYKHCELDGVTSDRYEIPLSSLSMNPGGELYIAAHAVIGKENSDGNIQKETAWSQGPGFPGKNWAMYSIVTLPEATGSSTISETAWAYGPYTFIDAGLSTKWGWYLQFFPQMGTDPQQ